MALIQTLLAAALRPAGGRLPGDAAEVLRSTRPQAWERALTELENHRIVPLVAWGVRDAGLTDAVPKDILAKLDDDHRKTLLTNGVHLHALARTVEALGRHGVSPVVWKGAVLADTFYPDPGCRWMGDIDFSIEGDEVDATTAGFAEAGFTPPEMLETEDAIYFQNPMGILFDVHHRVRLFEAYSMDELTEQLPPRHTKLDGLRVLEANAMIVHLVVHMDGHRDGMGYLLSWLNDLAFVIATWGDRLDVDRIEALMPDEASMRTLLRVMRFYRDDFGIEPPEQFRARVDAAGEMTLASVLRERTRVQWGLPTARGWARLLACRVAGRDRKGRMYPSVGDLLAMPGDLARERKG